MVAWEIANKTISGLSLVNAGELIYPWGTETADTDSFFSQEEGVGWRYTTQRSVEKTTKNSYYYGVEVAAKDGQWRISSKDQLLPNNGVRRVAVLKPLKESLLMDFVMRFRFRKTAFTSAEIDKNRIYHNDSNKNHQFPVRCISLYGDKCTARIVLEKYECVDGFSPFMYVRDSRNEWVVHVRLFPVKNDIEIIKLCSSLFKTKALPRGVSDRLLKFQPIRDALWYRGERAPYKNKFIRKLLNPNAFGLVSVPAGSTLKLQALCSFEPAN